MQSLEVPVCLCLLLSRGTEHVCKHAAWKGDPAVTASLWPTSFLFVSDIMLPLTTKGENNLQENGTSFPYYKFRVWQVEEIKTV